RVICAATSTSSAPRAVTQPAPSTPSTWIRSFPTVPTGSRRPKRDRSSVSGPREKDSAVWASTPFSSEVTRRVATPAGVPRTETSTTGRSGPPQRHSPKRRSSDKICLILKPHPGEAIALVTDVHRREAGPEGVGAEHDPGDRPRG